MTLHGRKAEREAMRELVEAARNGSGGALLVTGPPGAGRSSLLAEAAEDASADMSVLRADGVPGESDLPFSGLAQLLAPVLAELEHLPAPQAAALGNAVGLGAGPTPTLPVGAAVTAVLGRTATRRPLLLVVDDLQLLDRASVAALRYAARRLVALPVAALLSAESPPKAALAEAGLRRLALRGLDEDAAAALLADHGWAPPSPVRAAAIAATGGNPHALIQLARAASPADRIEDLAGRVSVPLGDRQRAAFLRQVAGLPAPTRAFLVVAAAAGEDGPISAVFDAARGLGLGADALAPAERAGAVAVRPTRIAFRHPLLRAAIYQDAPYLERLAAHGALAAAIDPHDADTATRHRAIAAQGPDEALARALERIALAHPASATEAAVMHWAARLSACGLPRLQRTTAAALAAWRSGQIDFARELSARLSTVSEPQTEARLARLRGLLEITGGDPVTAFTRLERVAGDLLPSTPVDAALLLVLAVAAALDAGELGGGRRAAATVARLGGPAGRIGERLGLALDGRLPADTAEPAQMMADMPAELSEHSGMREVLVMALGALGPHPVLTREFGVSVCAWQRGAGMFGTLTMNLLWLADVDIHLGHYDEAAASAEEVLQFTRDTGQQAGSALALAHLARIAAIRGDHAACRTLAAQSLTTGTATRARAAAAHASWAVALAALAEGDPREAFDRLLLLTEPGTPFCHELIARLAASDLVEAAVRAEQLGPARRITAEFTDWALRSTLPWAESHMYRCQALVVDDDEEAHRLFSLAGKAASGGHRPFDLARTALLRGEALRRDRRRAEARPPLRLAVELFDGQGARRWAEIARSQLRGAGGLGASPRDDRPVATLLTAQELQVARLAADGLSNKEIAALLFISPRTVGYHLYKLFPKLGISTRSQLRNVEFDDVEDADAANA
ncbi:AAA family ATPase [Pseudonocardia sp. MH-G8]|uniref:AAA family ATPase n=1 Tax=Pseudonocardia sp. MH-G8 TaxID=1854588 RepID=UPI0013044C33|nr:AAA family ATPase [Pseudonocardia sp. MH-G8]